MFPLWQVQMPCPELWLLDVGEEAHSVIFPVDPEQAIPSEAQIQTLPLEAPPKKSWAVFISGPCPTTGKLG